MSTTTITIGFGKDWVSEAAVLNSNRRYYTLLFVNRKTSVIAFLGY